MVESETAPTGRRPGPAMIGCAAAVLAAAGVSVAPGWEGPEGISRFGGRVPLEFVLFDLTLLGVVLFHHHTLGVAGGGLASVPAYTRTTGERAGHRGLALPTPGGRFRLTAIQAVGTVPGMSVIGTGPRIVKPRIVGPDPPLPGERR